MSCASWLQSVPDNSPEVVEKLTDNEATADISPEVVAMSADNDEHHDDEVDGKVVHSMVQEKARPTGVVIVVLSKCTCL